MAPSAARRRALHLSLVAALAAAAAAPAVSAPAAQTSSPVVAVLRVEAPPTSSILLHGTVPLAKGKWKNADTMEPFRVLDHDGKPVATQCEVVSRYPSAQDGVDVAEVVARVTRPPGKKAGAALQYKVVYDPHEVPAKPAPSFNALLNGPAAVPASVKSLLNDPQGVLIEVVDVFGNAYRVAPFDGTGKLVLHKHGPVQTQLKISQVLRPTPAVSGPMGTLPHHLGVDVYLTVSSQDQVVGFDVRFHNAHSGLDDSNPLDDPLGKVYFRSINLYVGAPWFFVQDFFDPFLDVPTSGEGGYVKFPLVKQPPDGTVHGMRWQQQFHRRLALAPLDLLPDAQRRARGEGLGFATRGKNAQGDAYWSWWNPATARWFPQKHRLPSLDHVGKSELDFWINKEHDSLVSHLVNGTASGPVAYPISSPVLGWAHPYGSSYGGMTSGLDIFLYDGVRLLEAGSQIGYQTATITHRMQTDRMPNVLYDADGTPTTVAEWQVPKAGGDYVPFEHFHTPILTSSDPFGVSKAPTFQADFVDAAGIAAPWIPTLFKYSAYDYQHLVRYTRVAKTLTWLANDTLAKDDLLAQAETFHLSYHEYSNSAGGYVQAVGMKADLQSVAENGPVGFSFGRGEGWGFDCASAVYATGTPQWRSENLAWIKKAANLIADGQAACSGFIQSTVSDKFFDSKYRARQIIEQSILENMLVGMTESVFRGSDAATSAMLDGVVVKSCYSMLSPIAWHPSNNAPWAFTAVAPFDQALPPWCKLKDMPTDTHSSYVDGFQNWSSFAYGFQRTGDIVFLLAAQHQIGGDLLPLMIAQGTDNVENRAALLALLETFAGIGF